MCLKINVPQFTLSSNTKQLHNSLLSQLKHHSSLISAMINILLFHSRLGYVDIQYHKLHSLHRPHSEIFIHYPYKIQNFQQNTGSDYRWSQCPDLITEGVPDPKYCSTFFLVIDNVCYCAVNCLVSNWNKT